MRVWASIASRELSSMFRLPVGWIATALFVFLTSVVFFDGTLRPGEPATLRYFFNTSAVLLIVIAPAVSMRLFSEEFRTGSIEPLRTSPASDWTLVLGKYTGAVLFLLAMLLPTLAFPVVLWTAAEPAPDVGPVLSGYLSLVLAGMLYLAVGTLMSAMTSSQTLAFLATLMSLVLLMVVTGPLAEQAPRAIAEPLLAASINQRVSDLAKGVIDTSNVAFFVIWSAWLLVLAAIALDVRRWR